MKNSIKKIAALLLALAVMIPVGVIGVFADGTAASTPTYTATTKWEPNENGVFEIATPGDLLAMASNRKTYANYKDKTIVLTADIDLNPGWDASTKTEPTNIWASLWNFQGTLDGQGHSIKGLYVKNDAGGNCSFIVQSEGATYKNLKVENSYFSGTVDSGFVACVKGATTFTDVYIDTIVEASETGAGGFVSWFFTSSASAPSATFTNCVFAGSVSAATYAGGILGTNFKADNDKGTGDFSVTMTDCANYGTVTSKAADMAGGLVGNAVNKATFTRCYNAGTVATAIANLNQVADKTQPVVIEDTYYLAGTDVKALTKTAAATNVTLKYDGATTTDAKTATVAELVAKTPFKAAGEYKGWATSKDGKTAMPLLVMENLEGHNYTTKVTAPTCANRGFTTYTCANCGHSYEGDYVEPVAHTEGADWIVDRPATEEFAGSRHKECTVCGKTTQSGVIPQLEPTETTAPETEAPEDETTGTAGNDKEKSGCGSSIALGSALGMSAMIALGAAVVFKKRK
ncbi:MAG: hypothetical protein IJZ80_04600 [Clostridia bacterium]|nr:hypothetical protein [Clostridia bacterium]